MKKLLCLIFALLLVLPLCSFSVEKKNLVDMALLLEDNERESLEEELGAISARYSVDVVILTVGTIGDKTAKEFADDFYDYNGYADDGILLLIAISEREWAISTSGDCIDTFEAGIDFMADSMLGDLGAGEYHSAFLTFSSLCEDFLRKDAEGTPYRKGRMPGDTLPVLRFAFFSLLIGFAAAFIVTFCMKKALKSIRRAENATFYIKKGSFALTESRDIYLYCRVTKVPKDSGSGSSSRRSSSGRSHGGGSGRF